MPNNNHLIRHGAVYFPGLPHDGRNYISIDINDMGELRTPWSNTLVDDVRGLVWAWIDHRLKDDPAKAMKAIAGGIELHMSTYRKRPGYGILMEHKHTWRMKFPTRRDIP